MRIIQDGSVFRIELDSTGGFETRISFAVNAHSDMMRPRLEISDKGLKQLFMRMVSHIRGADLVNDEYTYSYRTEVVMSILRILEEIATDETFMHGLSAELRGRIQPQPATTTSPVQMGLRPLLGNDVGV